MKTRRGALIASVAAVVTALTAASSASAATAPAACTTPAWHVVPSPNAGSGDNGLAALDIIAANDIWTVGSSLSGDVRSTLIEHWNGRRWSIVPSPNGSQPVNWLTGVSAVSPTDVWAVGFTNDGNGFSSQSFNLILHWNGTSWTEVPAPNPIPDPNPGGYPVSNELYAVKAISANNVWAVGHLFTFSGELATILHWDGSSWSNASPVIPSRFSRLRSIDALSATDMWAVGEIQRDYTQQTLAMHYNGSSWSLVPSPNASPNADYILSVSMAASNDVWAVGYGNQVFGFSQHWQTESMHWNGTTWSLVEIPDINQLNNYMRAVTAPSSTQVFAVGFWDTGSKLRTLAERWDGTQWGFQTSSNAGDVIDELVAVDSAAPRSLWSVGQYFGAFTYRTLIERFGC
ncbi:MAG TPA: hypothetical protein VKA30_08235 [Actinomycetota bacterium]|nr:hypothetical protein [Actinomycetota bacterium]